MATGLSLERGNGKYGIAVGYATRDCSTCKGRAAGALAGNFSGFALGIRVQEDNYSGGLLLNPNGEHRVGFVAEMSDPDGNANNIILLWGRLLLRKLPE